MRRASQFIALLLPLVHSLQLPRCTIAVAGANGRVGSMVCRELLRNHPQVTVRALVRSATDPYQGYGRLSYEVGAEEGKMDIAPAWRIGDGGGFSESVTVEFDEERQSGYGLDRLEIFECELRYPKDVEQALGDVDAVVYCASAFNAFRQRLPDRLDDAANSIAKAGMNLFELRLGKALFGEPDEDGSAKPRKEASQGKTADVEGLGNVLSTLSTTRRRRATLAELTGGGGGRGASKAALPPLVLLSSAAHLGYDDAGLPGSSDLRENEFGFRKRSGEEAVRDSKLPHVIVRSAAIDDAFTEEGLGVNVVADADRVDADAVKAGVKKGAEGAKGAIGVGSANEADEEKRRRIHPRDLATYLVGCLSGAASLSTIEQPSGGSSDVATLDAQIVKLEKAKATAVLEQDFAKAGELLEEVTSLKSRRAETAQAWAAKAEGEASRGGERPSTSTVEVWTSIDEGPFKSKR